MRVDKAAAGGSHARVYVGARRGGGIQLYTDAHANAHKKAPFDFEDYIVVAVVELVYFCKLFLITNNDRLRSVGQIKRLLRHRHTRTKGGFSRLCFTNLNGLQTNQSSVVLIEFT